MSHGVGFSGGGGRIVTALAVTPGSPDSGREYRSSCESLGLLSAPPSVQTAYRATSRYGDGSKSPVA